MDGEVHGQEGIWTTTGGQGGTWTTAGGQGDTWTTTGGWGAEADWLQRDPDA